MAEAEGITAWRSRALLRMEAARRNGNAAEERNIAAELKEVHVALGERRTGTDEEQRTYLLARSTKTPLPDLAALGIDTNAWPTPPPSSPARSDPAQASPDTEKRITDLFESAGPLSEPRQSRPRYEARYRPQDGQRFRGRPFPWAICETRTGLPIAYHEDRELAEYQADTASALHEQRGRPT